MSSPILRLRRRLRQEKGQVLALMAVSAVALLGLVAFVVDIGRLYYAHRAIQASADAAATAGAQALPDPNAAIALARQYSAEPGNKNAQANLGTVTATYTTKCISGMPCNPANTIVVNESSQVSSIFAKIFGFNSWTVTAKATASMSGGTPLPLDVMIVLDRTGSMCQPCSKIDNASGRASRVPRRDDPVERQDRAGRVAAGDAASRSVQHLARAATYDDATLPVRRSSGWRATSGRPTPGR